METLTSLIPPSSSSSLLSSNFLSNPSSFANSKLPPCSIGCSTSNSCSKRIAVVRASRDCTSLPRDGPGLFALAGKGLAAMALSAVLQLSPVLLPQLANASEFNILNDGPPKTYLVDDAGVINRVTKSDIKRLLADLEERKGYHIDMVTLRKLTTKADVFEFADQVLEKWYPTIESGNNKGLVLLVTTQKEGAVTGGPAFIEAAGEKVLEAVVSENLPVLATDEKYNEAFLSTAKRLAAALDGLPDPGGPKFQENKRESNFKTKEETEEKRGQFTTVVGGLLVIAFVVPMAQYYAYVSKK